MAQALRRETPMPRYDADSLRAMSTAVFAATGFAPEEARLIGRLMVEANLVGHDTHGVRHIPVYVERIREGHIVPGAEVEVVDETPTTAVLDGHRTLGHVAATRGMERAMDKAREARIAAVAVRNQEHVGRVGAYPEMAARAGLVALTFCNAQGRGIQIAPFGGIERRIGANPIAVAFPRPGDDPVLLDISTSAVAINKIRQASDRGVEMPEGAILDPDGRPSRDPADFLERGGAALPLGGLNYGHKGFGLAVIVDLFAGVLGGSGTAINCHETHLDNGTFHIVLDPGAFIESARYGEEVSALAEYLCASRPLPGTGQVMLPGDFEARNRRHRSAHGIEVDAVVWERIAATLAELGVPQPAPLA